MRWVKPAKLPVIIAWLIILGVVGWLGMNPRFVAPYASRLVGRHLLGMEQGGLQVRDFRIRVFEGMDLYGVSLTLPSASGGMTLASADTVEVDFQGQDLLAYVPRLRRVVISRPEIFSRSGADTLQQSDSESPEETGGFPRILIEHLEIREGFCEFSGSDGRVTEEISRLDWNGSVRSDEEVALELHRCDLHLTSRNSILEDLRGQVVIDREQIRVSPVYGTLNGHDARVTGTRRWTQELDIAVLGQGVSVAEIEDLIDMTIGFNARGDIAGSFVSARDTLTYAGTFTGELEGYQMEQLTGRAVVGSEDVLLSELAGVINGATFTGGGHFDISRQDSVSFVLEGDVQDVDLSKGLIPDEDDLPVTDGRGFLRIEHTDLPLWTRVTGILHDGFIEIIPFDTCRVDVVALADEVQFHRVEVDYRDLNAVLEGVSDTSQVFTGELTAQSSDVTTLPEGWNWPALSGGLRAQGSLHGLLDDLDFTGVVLLDSLGLGPVSALFSQANLQVDRVLGDPRITTSIRGQGLTLGGVPFGDFRLEGAASSQMAVIDTFTAVYGDTSVGFDLSAVFTDTLQHFSLDSYSHLLEGTAWAIADPVTFSLRPGYLHLPGLLLESEQGVLAMEALYHEGREVSGSLLLEQFDLGLLDPFLRNDEPLTGKITADVLVSGRPDDPVVQLSGLLTDSSFRLARVDSLQVDASFNQGTVWLNRVDLASEFGGLEAAGTVAHPGAGVEDFWPDADLDLDLTVTQGDWAFLEQFAIPALDRLAGTFDGQIQVAGTTSSPLIEGQVFSAPFHVHWLHLDQLTGTIWADSDALVLADLKGNKSDLALTGRLEIPVDLDFLSEPVTPLNEPFYMQLDIPPNSNLAPLAQATNAFVQASGRGSAHVVVSGPLVHPFYQGELQIREAGFVLRDLEEIYREASCDGTFQGDVLQVKNIRGEEGLRGTFEGEGQVVFRGLELESFDINLNLDRFLLASIPDLRAVVRSDNARMTSVFVGPDSLLVPKFTGDFEVLKGRYTGNFKEKEGAVDPMAATVAPDWLGDLQLHGAPRSSRIINREMELFLGGDLDLVRDETGMYLRGALDVNSGRLIVFNNSFKVVRGRLDLSREVGFNPMIDLDATTSFRLKSQVSSNSIIENIQVHVGNTILSPEITFSSDRGYSREAIQRMLLGLEPFATPEGDRERLANTSISAGFNVIEREIAREIQIFDTFEIDQIQRQSETGAELDPLIGVGKFIGNDLYLKFAQGIRQDDRDILVEYQINNHLLLQSEVRRRIDENQGGETYNLDLKYRFEY
jgi:hypothetical protein